MSSPCSGARRSGGGLSVELHRHGRQPVGELPVDHDVADVPVRLDLRVVEEFGNGLHRCPRGVEPGEQLLPLGVAFAWRTPRRARRHRPRRSPGAPACRRSVDPRQVLAPDEPAEVGPVAVRLEEDQLNVSPVFGPVDPDERIDQRPSPTRRLGLVPAQRGEDVRGQGPDGRGEQGDVDDGSLARFGTA